MKFEPVSPVRSYERIVEQVEQAMLAGEIKPGDRLPSERDLMSQFDVSRSTVREALRVLQSTDLIRSRQGDPRGPEVLAASPSALRRSLHRLASSAAMSLAELVQFRMLLEGSAYVLAGQLRASTHLAELDSALAAMTEAFERDNENAFAEADLAFHDVVANATGNTLIVVCGQVVRDIVLELIEDKLAHAKDRAALMRSSLDHHGLVLRDIRDGNGEHAAMLARQALYDYYAEYVPENERGLLTALLG